VNKLKIQESEILESIQSLKQRILKSDITPMGKLGIEKELKGIEDAIRNYYVLEYIKIKKVGNNNNKNNHSQP